MHFLYSHLQTANAYGALLTGPWIRIRYESGIRIQKPLFLHMASIWIRAACCAAWERAGTMVELQFSSAMRLVCAPCGDPARPHWIRIQWIRFRCPYEEPLFLHILFCLTNSIDCRKIEFFDSSCTDASETIKLTEYVKNT